jgi:MFS family permease
VATGCALAVAASLLWLRPGPVVRPRNGTDDGSLRGAMAYLRRRPDLRTVLVCSALVSLFAAHTALVTLMMATTVFGQDASRLGVLVTAVAAGSIAGSLLAARRERLGPGVLAMGAALLCAASTSAALAPTFRSYTATLFILGLGSMTFFLTSTTMVQLATERHVRGRAVGLLSMIQIGMLALGAPLIGWIGTSHGARWMHACAALASLATVAVCVVTIRFRRDVFAVFHRAVAALEAPVPAVQGLQEAQPSEQLVTAGPVTVPGSLPTQESEVTRCT